MISFHPPVQYKAMLGEHYQFQYHVESFSVTESQLSNICTVLGEFCYGSEVYSEDSFFDPLEMCRTFVTHSCPIVIKGGTKPWRSSSWDIPYLRYGDFIGYKGVLVA